MIGGVTRHGRTHRDSRALAAHLLREPDARVEMLDCAAEDLPGALRTMEIMRDGSKADAAFLHIHLSPARAMTDEELRRAAEIVRGHLGAEDHPAALVVHEKPRRGGEGGRHAHLVLGRVGPEGDVLPSGFEKVRLETAVRIAEFELGEAPTLGRHHASAVRWLREHDRADVADWLEAAHGPKPDRPTSAASPDRRQGLARQGLELADVRERVAAAWAASDSPQAFRHALREQGIGVSPGRKPGLWIVAAGDVEVGSLDRIIRRPRREVTARMQQQETVDAAEATPARDESPQGDLRRGQARPGDCREPDPAARAPGAAGRERGRPAGRDQGDPLGDPGRAGPDAAGDRRADPETQRWSRGQQAVAVRNLAAAGRQAVRKRPRVRHDDIADVRAAIRSAQGRTGLSETLDDLAKRAREIAASWTATLYRIDPDTVLRDRLRLANERAAASRLKEQRRAPDEPERAPQPRM
jgi:hypothetical protein